MKNTLKRAKTTLTKATTTIAKAGTRISQARKTLLDNRPKIKIQLDYKTVLTVRSLNAFNAWKERYPEAVIID